MTLEFALVMVLAFLPEIAVASLITTMKIAKLPLASMWLAMIPTFVAVKVFVQVQIIALVHSDTPLKCANILFALESHQTLR